MTDRLRRGAKACAASVGVYVVVTWWLLHAHEWVESLVRGAIFGVFVAIAFALLPPARRRWRPKIVGFAAAAAVLASVFAAAVADLEVKRHADDYCVVSAPPATRESFADDSPVPGRWTCVYRDPSGREVRRTMSLRDVFG